MIYKGKRFQIFEWTGDNRKELESFIGLFGPFATTTIERMNPGDWVIKEKTGQRHIVPCDRFWDTIETLCTPPPTPKPKRRGWWSALMARWNNLAR